MGTLAEGLGCFPLDDQAYPRPSHCHPLSDAIRSLIDFGNLVRPLDHSVLYRQQKTGDAAPQCISGRTSYLLVRLAFHPYPQFIQAVFNRHWFGRPRRNYLRFPLTMGRSRGFGSADGHEYALFVLAFALATPLNGLTYDQQQLAGSFCKRHAVTPINRGSDCL